MSRLLRTQTPSQPPAVRLQSPASNAGASTWSPQPSWQTAPDHVAPTRTAAPPPDRSSGPRAVRRSIVNAPALAAPAEIIEAPTKRTEAKRTANSIGRGLRQAATRRVFGLLALAAIPVAFALITRFQPSILYAVIAPLPSVIGAPLLHVLDTAVTTMAPVHEGLTWIDVGDPRLRRADKLPIAKAQSPKVQAAKLPPRDR